MGSGSFHFHANIVGKTLITTVLRLSHDFLSLKNDVNVPLKRDRHYIIVGFLKVTDEKEQDPDPEPDPTVSQRYRSDPRIRSRTKMSRIWNTANSVTPSPPLTFFLPARARSETDFSVRSKILP
jgi:hypothetical protein